MDTGAAVAANGAKPANRNTNTNSPTPIRAANGNGHSSSGRGRGRTGPATETLEMLLGLSVLVRLRARPANLLNGAKFFSISISISSCRRLTFCGCYSSCFCCCRCCICCVCVLPACCCCLRCSSCQIFAFNIQLNWLRFVFIAFCSLLPELKTLNTFAGFFNIFYEQRSAALPQRADRAVSQVS